MVLDWLPPLVSNEVLKNQGREPVYGFNMVHGWWEADYFINQLVPLN